MQKTVIIGYLSRILIIIAFSIQIAHIVIPHSHGDHDAMGIIFESGKNPGLLDFLGNLFHHDLGEGHLENYLLNQGSDFSMLVEFNLNSFPIAYFERFTHDENNLYISKDYFSKQLIPPDSNLNPLHKRRGPPKLI